MITKKYITATLALFFLSFSFSTGMEAQPSQYPELRFWTVGGASGAVKRFGKDFSSTLRELNKEKETLDALLLAVAEHPRTREQIAQISGLPESRVVTLLFTLQSVNVVKKHKETWKTALPVITDKEMISLKKNLAPLAANVSSILKKQIALIKDSYEKVKSPEEPSWMDVSHFFVDKILVDGTFHGAISDLEEEKGILELYSDPQRALPAFFLEVGENLTTFGSNWYPFHRADIRREIYVLHGTLLGRYNILLNQYRSDPDLISGLFKLPFTGKHPLSPKEKAVFQKLGFIENNHFLVPVIKAGSVKALLPLIETAGKEGAEAVFAGFSVILDSFKKSPYAQFLNGEGDYIQVCYHTLFSLIIDRLIEEEVLPPIPRPAPEYFGVYITLGRVFEPS